MQRAIVVGLILISVGAVATGCDAAGGLEVMPLQDQRTRVNETLTMDLRVREAMGGEQWEFSAPSVADIDRTAALFQDGASAVFRWTPLASHVGRHLITFTVRAGIGEDSETAEVEVIQAGGAPRFLQPSTGEAFDLSRASELRVPIRVVDEDNTSVTIREREPVISGGNLEVLGGFAAEWTWRPSPQQVAARLRYTLHLEADDGDHPPVPHDFEVVLLSEGRNDCAGAAPQIVSSSPTAPDRLETIQDYAVDATITDDQGFKDNPLLYFSTEQPTDPSAPDVTAMQSVTFEQVGADAFQAFIPNLRLSPEGERTIYYVVMAIDNDDERDTACDHTTVSDLRQFVVAEPDTPDPVGYCARCSNDGQCDGGVCIAAEPLSFCGMDCGACPEDAECRTFTSRDGTVADQCAPPEGGSCSSGDCELDANEPGNDSINTAPILGVGIPIDGTLCFGDVDFYTMDLLADRRYEINMAGWDSEVIDIDLHVYGPTGTQLGGSYNEGSMERVELCPTESGYHFALVEAVWQDAGAPYSIEINELTGDCCVDDAHEDGNDDRETAPVVTCGEEAIGAICGTDIDWWAAEITTPTQVEVTITCEDGAGDLDLSVYSDDGPLGDDTNGGCNSTVVVDLPVPGTYYALVQGYRGDEGEYVLTCEALGGGTCTPETCPAGTVCDVDSGCIDDSCDDPGNPAACPTGYLCPEPGGIAGGSHCVRECTSSADCRPDYTCKAFPEGRGCGIAGSGESGAPCESFEDCAGERTCLSSGSTGYCAEINCNSTADCPEDTRTGTPRPAQCTDVGGGGGRVCLMDCLMGDLYCDDTAGECVRSREVGGEDVFVCALPSHVVPAP